MILNQNAIERAAQQSINGFFKKNQDDHAIHSIREGLTGKQKDLLIDKIATIVIKESSIFDHLIQSSSNAALLTNEGVAMLEKKMIDMITENALTELTNELQLISKQLVKNRGTYRSVLAIIDDWSSNKLKLSTNKHFDDSFNNAFLKSLPEINLLIADPASVDPVFSQDLHRSNEKGMEKIFDDLSSSANFKNIDHAKNSFQSASNALLKKMQEERKDASEDTNDKENADLQKYLIRATARAMRVLAQPYENILTFDQTRQMLATAQKMLMAYVLEDIGKNTILHKDPSNIKGMIAETIAANQLHMEKFLAVHVELTNSFENTLSVNANDKESNEKMTELISSVGDLTMSAGDIIADIPSVHGPHATSVKFGQMAKGGDAGFVVGAGISLLSVPAEYAIAKLRGEKAPEMTKEKAWQTTVKTVGFGLAVSAMCVPHIAVILTVTGAAIGAVSAVGSSAHHYYEKSKLKDLIDDLKNKLPDLQTNAQKALTEIETLASLAHKINDEGHLLTKDEIYAFTGEFHKLKSNLDVHMHKLQSEMKKLSDAVITLRNEFSTQSTVDATTGALTGATYLTGAALNIVPVLNVAGNALMIATDVISLTYSATSKLQAAASTPANDAATTPSKNVSTMFSRSNHSQSENANAKLPEKPRLGHPRK